MVSNPDGSRYSWIQAHELITITFQVAANTSTKDVTVKFTENELYCSIKNESSPRITGILYGKINVADSSWQMESKPTGKFIEVNLEIQPLLQPWPVVVISGKDGEFQMDCQSLYELGNMYHHQGNDVKAIDVLTLAAGRDCISAQLKLAAWYEIGKSSENNYPLERNQASSHFWHLKAAELGNIEACYVVASSFYHGSHSLSKDYSKATKWFSSCVKDLGPDDKFLNIFISAAFQLGLMHMQGGFGLGDPQPVKAVEYWKLSALRGHPDSIFNIGVFTLNGFGMEPDVTVGIQMIKLAISANPALGLPPPLTGLSDKELDTFIEQASKREVPNADESQREFMDRVVGTIRKSPKPLMQVESIDQLIDASMHPKQTKARKSKPKANDDMSVIGLSMVAAVVAVGIIYYFNKK